MLAGFMAVDADAGDVAGKKRAGYGAMRLLELPKDTTVKGPGQVQNDIESSNISSPRFTLTLSQFHLLKLMAFNGQHQIDRQAVLAGNGHRLGGAFTIGCRRLVLAVVVAERTGSVSKRVFADAP